MELLRDRIWSMHLRWGQKPTCSIGPFLRILCLILLRNSLPDGRFPDLPESVLLVSIRTFMSRFTLGLCIVSWFSQFRNHVGCHFVGEDLISGCHRLSLKSFAIGTMAGGLIFLGQISTVSIHLLRLAVSMLSTCSSAISITTIKELRVVLVTCFSTTGHIFFTLERWDDCFSRVYY